MNNVSLPREKVEEVVALVEAVGERVITRAGRSQVVAGKIKLASEDGVAATEAGNLVDLGKALEDTAGAFVEWVETVQELTNDIRNLIAVVGIWRLYCDEALAHGEGPVVNQ